MTASGYLGIWYTYGDKIRIVWVANSNTPILNNFGVLTIDSKGRLKLMSGGSTLVNISDQVGTGNVSATLKDSGNFVVMDETDNRILWQSFDHPGSTLLQGMKLGFNHTTMQNWTLTSWLSDDIPATGAFTLSWEPTQESGQLVIQRRGEPYWTSGELKDQNFEHMPSLDSNSFPYNHNLNHVLASDGYYFTFSVGDERMLLWNLIPDERIVDCSGFVLTPHEFCYGYQSDDGCVNSTVPECRSHGDTFQQRRAAFIGNPSTYDNNSSPSISDCMEKCWNDCNCVGFANYSNGVGCVFWGGNVNYTLDEPNNVIKYLLVPANSSIEPTNSSNGKSTFISINF
ncbi:G-type lectin S-receptor-like serine/threonine-protein kinase CES101 [Cornus florida]|uniref:G-type lectin S-receptor-like serine/threonine-protein kinase CES101 n=1 Tax=Cornus florida TaxID=4283 RepID=UPI0028A26ACE|nr:G-type lectin S-receptor-like serine/threonine-protein kinase CES101 [Cornus florida]